MKPEDCYYLTTRREPQTPADFTYFYFTEMLSRDTSFDFHQQGDVKFDWDSKRIIVYLARTPKNRQFMKSEVNNRGKWKDYDVVWLWKK